MIDLFENNALLEQAAKAAARETLIEKARADAAEAEVEQLRDRLSTIVDEQIDPQPPGATIDDMLTMVERAMSEGHRERERLRVEVEGLRGADASHPEPYASATLNAILGAFDAMERHDLITTIETTPIGVSWFIGKRSLPYAEGEADGMRAAVLAAGGALACQSIAPRIATPAEAAEIARTMVPSQSPALIAKVAALDLEALAHEQAGKVRRGMREAFQSKWGAFVKCEECGAPRGDCTCPMAPRVAGYAPPPRAT